MAVGRDLILTNAHVIQGAAYIAVTDYKNTRFFVDGIVGKDDPLDLALLKSREPLEPAELGDSSQLKVGERIVAVGNPRGLLKGTVSDGIISGLREIGQEGPGPGKSNPLPKGHRKRRIMQTLL
ncbi:MAG: trypsin-like peptidase domain-containing protein [Firmicutes bacterium]|nr:trypsin-like peptidase domain-containing protein [Bacillota bacterium]